MYLIQQILLTEKSLFITIVFMIDHFSQELLKRHPAVVIPAYQPDEQLSMLVQELRKQRAAQTIIVVDDGSDLSSQSLFKHLKSLQVQVLQHSQNFGKGHALKTAFAHYLKLAGSEAVGVITADADGQHSVEDILILSDALAAAQENLHLGVRDFSPASMKIAGIPWRSRFGNVLTSYLFRKMNAVSIYDTQTGLRGIPLRLLKMILNSRLSGYELEMEMLLMAALHRMSINQIPIKTIYYNRNAQSHFSPMLDSLKIMRVIFQFLLNKKNGKFHE